MAVNLIDRTKLDACLDAEADAIRAKTGDSNDITFDFANNKGFADAIAAIPSGGSDFSPFEIYKTSFTPVSDDSSVSFSIEVPEGKTIVWLVGAIDNPASYASDNNIDKITGFMHSRVNTYFGGLDGGFYLLTGDITQITAINTATKADYWSNGVAMSYNSKSKIFNITNSRGKKFVAGANYTAWAIFG